MQNFDDIPLLRVENLCVKYGIGGGIFSRAKKTFNAVDDISFEVKKGEILGLVGESGSGKTTTGRAIIRLAPISGGEIFYGGEKISALSNAEFMPYRKKIQMIFQDPFNSLNPRMNILQIISEPLDIHFKNMAREQKRDRVAELLETVGALDVSVQAQIVNLLADLREKLGLTMLFVAHDIAVVEYLCDRIMVMTRGKIVETGESESLCANPQHPYTKKLIASVPTF